MEGTVIFYLPELGYGFIRPDDAQVQDPELFVHFSQVPVRSHGRRYLIKRERVEFELGKNPKNGNTVAVKVSPLTETASSRRTRCSQTGG